jgi:hypothetical protein
MWWLHGNIDTSELTRRAVVQVEVSDIGRLFWLVLEPDDSSVCFADPGFEVDAVLRADLSTLYQVWEGAMDLIDAVRADRAELTGPRWLVSVLPRWLQGSPVVPYVRAARATG